eukprot:8756994-Karenia_brevis.AAC.1
MAEVIVNRVYLYCDAHIHVDNQTAIGMMPGIMHIMHDDLPALTARALYFYANLSFEDHEL